MRMHGMRCACQHGRARGRGDDDADVCVPLDTDFALHDERDWLYSVIHEMSGPCPSKTAGERTLWHDDRQRR